MSVPDVRPAGMEENTIEIRLSQVSQLFNMLDPFPFRERDLAPEAEDYIVGWARELPRRVPIRIIVHLPSEEADSPGGQGIPEAVTHFFHYRQEGTAQELRELFRVGRWSLLIGASVLALCLLLAQAVGGRLGTGAVSRFLEESLIIVGWVANWRPIEIFLYDWWPLTRRRDLFGRLAAARVEVHAISA